MSVGGGFLGFKEFDHGFFHCLNMLPVNLDLDGRCNTLVVIFSVRDVVGDKADLSVRGSGFHFGLKDVVDGVAAMDGGGYHTNESTGGNIISGDESMVAKKILSFLKPAEEASVAFHLTEGHGAVDADVEADCMSVLVGPVVVSVNLLMYLLRESPVGMSLAKVRAPSVALTSMGIRVALGSTFWSSLRSSLRNGLMGYEVLSLAGWLMLMQLRELKMGMALLAEGNKLVVQGGLEGWLSLRRSDITGRDTMVVDIHVSCWMALVWWN